MLDGRQGVEKPCHIYCELPWGGVEDGLALEDWIAARPEFSGENPWNLSFVGLCPSDADRLPEEYRVGLEEFARGSQSSIIVPGVGGQTSNPVWVEAGQIDFGRHVEVYEEELWSTDSFERVVESGEPDAEPAEPLESLTALSFVVQGDRVRFVEMLKDLREGVYGEIWGAELVWPEAPGVFEFLTLTQGKLFLAQSTHPALEHVAGPGRGLLQVAGQITNASGLIGALRSPTDS